MSILEQKVAKATDANDSIENQPLSGFASTTLMILSKICRLTGIKSISQVIKGNSKENNNYEHMDAEEY